MRKDFLLLWISLVVLMATTAWAQITTLKPGGGDAELEAFCKAGGKGVGYDRTTGLYAATCITGFDTNGYFDYQDCTGVAAPDHACEGDDERALVDGIVHAYYAAAEQTRPFGTIWWPEFPGHNHGLYVYRGCGARDCPTFEQSLTPVDLRPGYRARNIASYKGLRWAGLGGDPDGPFMNGRQGVFLLNDAGPDATKGSQQKVDGDGQQLGQWVWRIGARPGENVCSSTDLGGGDWSYDCDFDNAYRLATDSPVNGRIALPLKLAAHCNLGNNDGDFCSTQAYCAPGGGTCDLDTTLSFTNYDSRITRICFSNDSTFAETSGVCDDDKRVVCDSNGAGGRTGAVQGSCDFTGEAEGEPDVGPCLPLVDAVADLLADGERVILSCSINNSDIDGNLGNNGMTVGYFEVKTVPSPGTCGTNGRYIHLGIDTYHVQTWPFQEGVITDVDKINYCRIVRPDWYDNGNGFNVEGIDFANVDYYGRDIPGDEDNDCDAGNEDECDGAPLLALGGGINGGLRHVGIWGCSHDGNMSCIDGGTEALFTKIHESSIKDCKRGLVSDASNWEFRDIQIDRCNAGNYPMFKNFASSSKFLKITVRNSFAVAFLQSTFARSVIADEIRFAGSNKFTYGAYEISNGFGLQITRNIIESLTSRFVSLQSTSNYSMGEILIAENMAHGGPNAPPFYVSYGPSLPVAWISITDFNETRQGEIRGVTIRDNTVEFGNLSNSCFVYFDIGDDNASGGTGRSNIGVEDYIQEVSLIRNSVRGTGAALTCAGDDGSSSDNDASNSVSVWGMERIPYMMGNRVNEVYESDFPYHLRQACGGDACIANELLTDCEDLAYGTRQSIFDDSASGACLDADTDGKLDGHLTNRFISHCCCDPAGDGGDGTWSECL